MGLSRLLWREDVDVNRMPLVLPWAVYAVNLAFAMVLSGGVGLWIPIILAIVLGLIPASVIFLPREGQPTRARSLQLSPDA